MTLGPHDAGYPGEPGDAGDYGEHSRWHVPPAVWASAAAVLVTVTVIAVLEANSGGSATKAPTTSPAQVVRTYLAALARGDAGTALAQGPHFGNKKLLDDTVLRAQQALAPLTAVTVGAAKVDGIHASVPARYRFGTRDATQTYTLTRRSAGWQLDATTFQVDPSAVSNLPTPTMFGRNVSKLNSISVFPGPLRLGTHNRYLAITQSDRWALSPFDRTASYAAPTVRPNAAGLAKVRAAAADYLKACTESIQLVPKRCPQEEDDPKAVPSSATWTLTTDLGKALTVSSSLDDPTVVTLSADLTWTCEYTAKPTRRTTETRTDTGIQNSVSGTVDLSAAELVFKPSS